MCEPQKPGSSRAVGLLAAGVVAAALLARVLAPLTGALPAVTFTILAMCAAGVEVVRRLIKYGRHLRPVRQRPAVRRTVGRPAITAGQRAIEAPKLPGVTVVLNARDYERMKS